MNEVSKIKNKHMKYQKTTQMIKLKLLVSLLIFTSFQIFGQVPGLQQDPEIGITEKLSELLPSDITLINQHGDTVILGDLLNKPTVVSFVYFRCPGICSPLMDGIAELIDRTDLEIGNDYQVLTISFDIRETTDLALQKKQNYLNMVQAEGAYEGWIFMTGDSANISRITTSAGFHFKRAGNDFIHTAALIVISPEGKITRYLNGTDFLPFEFKMSLVEASKGQIGSTINKVLQYCFAYDPQGQQYVLNITRVSGIMITFIAVSIFIWLTLRPLLRKKQHIGA